MPVRPARREDIAALSATLARAFQDDPVAAWVYRSARRRPHWMRRFFAWQLLRLLPQDATWTGDDREGAALWALPDRWREERGETLTLLRATLPGILPRLPRVARGLAEVEARHPTRPHLYLVSLGVDPARQRRGLGSELLAPGLALCDREGLPAYLETATEGNVAFYGRHGFRVIGDLTLPKGPTVWLLWREPGPADAGLASSLREHRGADGRTVS
jgi:ribosomal protein S18 acetylase RimI-like enzyme